MRRACIDMMALIGVIYFMAGVIKGVIGLGLPTTITFERIFCTTTGVGD